MCKLSEKILSIEESATLAMARKSREMRESGKEIINLSLGEPDFNTPSFIKEAAKGDGPSKCERLLWCCLPCCESSFLPISSRFFAKVRE